MYQLTYYQVASWLVKLRFRLDVAVKTVCQRLLYFNFVTLRLRWKIVVTTGLLSRPQDGLNVFQYLQPSTNVAQKCAQHNGGHHEV